MNTKSYVINDCRFYDKTCHTVAMWCIFGLGSSLRWNNAQLDHHHKITTKGKQDRNVFPASLHQRKRRRDIRLHWGDYSDRAHTQHTLQIAVSPEDSCSVLKRSTLLYTPSAWAETRREEKHSILQWRWTVQRHSVMNAGWKFWPFIAFYF